MAVNSGIFSDPNAVIDRAMRAMRRPAAPSRDAVYQTYAADQDVYNRTWKPTPYEPRLAEVVQVAEDLGVDLDTARDLIRESRGIEGGGIDITEHMAPNLQYANFLSLLQNHQQHLAPFVERQVTALTPAPTPRNEPARVAPSVPRGTPEEQERAEQEQALQAVGRRLGEEQMEQEALANEMAAQLAQDMQQMTPEQVASFQSMIAENARMAAAEKSEAAARAAMEDKARLDAMYMQEKSLFDRQPPAAPLALEPSRVGLFSPNVSLRAPVDVAPPVSIASVRQNNIADMLAEREAARNAAINAAINAPLEALTFDLEATRSPEIGIEDDPMAEENARMAAIEESQNALRAEMEMQAEMEGARQQEARALAAIEQAEIDALTAAIAQNYQEPNMPAPVTQAQINQAIAAGLIAPPTEATRSLQGPPGPTPPSKAPAGLADLNDVTEVTEMGVPGPAMSLADLAAAIAASREMDDTPPSYQNEMETAAEAAQAQAARDIAAAMAQNEMGMAPTIGLQPPVSPPIDIARVTQNNIAAAVANYNMARAEESERSARAAMEAQAAQAQAARDIAAAMTQNEMGMGMRSGPTPGSFRAAQEEDDVTEADVPGPAVSLGELAAAVEAARQNEMETTAEAFAAEMARQNEMETLNDVQNNPPAVGLFSSVPPEEPSFAPEFTTLTPKAVEELERALPQVPARTPTASLAPIAPPSRTTTPAPTVEPGLTTGPNLTESDRNIGFRTSVPGRVNDEDWEPSIQIQDKIPGSMTSQIDKYGKARTSYYKGIPDNEAEARTRQSLNANRALARALGLPEDARVGEIGRALTKAIKEGKMTAKQARGIISEADKETAKSTTPSRRSSLDTGLGILGRVLADLNPFSISPAQADTPRFQPQQPPREEPFRLPPPMLPPQLAPPRPLEMPDEIIRRYQLDRLRRQGQPRNPDDVPLDEDTPLPPSRGRPSPIPSPFPNPFTNPFTAPMPAPEPAPTPPAPQPAPSFTPTPGGSFRSAQDRGIDDKGPPSKSTPATSRNPTPAPAPAPVPSIAVPSPVPGVAAPDAAPNAPKGAGEPSTTGPGVASPSFGAGIGVGDSKDGKSSSYGNRSVDTTDEDPDGGLPSYNPSVTAKEDEGVPVSVLGIEPATRVAGYFTQVQPQATFATLDTPQQQGMQAINQGLATLSYNAPTPTAGYGVQSEDTTEADPDGGMPGGRTPDQTMAEQAATLGSLGNEQDGPGTNESTTTSDTTSPSGGGGDGNTPGTETTNYGEMGFGVFGGDGGQTGDTGDTSGGGRGGSGSVGGDVAGAAAAAAGLGSSPADGESTSGGPIADGGVVKPRMPKQYEEIIKRALRAARRSRAA